MKSHRLVMSAIMGIGIVAASAVSTYLANRWDSDDPLSVAIVTIAILAFMGLLTLTQPDDGPWQLTEAAMRTTIAGTIVIEYLVLVATVAFFKQGPEHLPPITQAMISNFTSIVGVVVAFYFGSSAYVQARKQGSDSEEPKKPPMDDRATKPA